LAPVIVRDLMKACRELVEGGQTIVLVEQNLAATLALAHRAYIINNGHVVHEAPVDELKANPDVLRRHLGVRIRPPESAFRASRRRHGIGLSARVASFDTKQTDGARELSNRAKKNCQIRSNTRIKKEKIE
jgi:ABC-type multidrug transport system ATPase subunit